jgi:Fe-S cluster biogenesis protein NfuA
MEMIDITLEFTPNPNTLKYVINRTLIERGAANFTSKNAAAKSPLALKLFDVPGVVGVMVGKNFVTVTKGETGDWESLNNGVMSTLKEHLSSGAEIFDADYALSVAPAASAGQGEGELENKIRTILDEEIRPAVAMDGGDITFERFEDGVVYLNLQGSCSGCPSSTATLKMGIETRLKAAIPEVQEVVST